MSILTVSNNPSLEGQARIHLNVTYSTAAGVSLPAAILQPWGVGPHPAILFVQGSGWTTSDIGYQLPQLAEYARAGYVVMTIVHRSWRDGYAFPAFLQDVKCAVRFLRHHAEKYAVDPARIAIFGTSSGGNASLMTAMTGDDPRYRTEEYGEYSDAVVCAVDCFGPTWMEKMPRPEKRQELIQKLSGGREPVQVMREMSPYCISDASSAYPPILFVHGDADDVVPFEQSQWMFDKLRALGKEAELICVHGAPHEGNFWSREVHGLIRAFLDAHLMNV